MKKSINCIALFVAFVAMGFMASAAEPVKDTKSLTMGSTVSLQSGESSIMNNSLSLGRPKYRSNNAGKFSIGGQVDYNLFRFGVGVKFSYDFTDILRFVFQGDYFIFSTRPINGDGVSCFFTGRQFDMSPAMNFVFGKNDFHFYIIAGLAVGWGYSWTLNIYADDLNKDGIYDRNELDPNWSFGLRAGVGIEYQITDSFRMYAE